ncbi:MAG: protein TolR [Candidatus Competibacterales bacterium]|nr:protein TolR [Candidatus Competibacterales bacterium]
MNAYRRRRRLVAEINIVPYVDVMLVLLVIFMITAPLINQGVELDLPQAESQPLPPSELRTLVLEIGPDGTYAMYQVGESGVRMTVEEARLRASAVLRRDPATPVVVRADATVDYGTVVQAMTVLQQAGAERVGLATRPPGE